jgi:hypothetical protein
MGVSADGSVPRRDRTIGGDTIWLFLVGLPALALGTWAGLKLFGRLNDAAVGSSSSRALGCTIKPDVGLQTRSRCRSTRERMPLVE